MNEQIVEQAPVTQQVMQPLPLPLLPEPIKVEGHKEKKGFWDKVWKTRKLEKNGMVAVLFLRENGMAEPMELRPSKGFFNIYGRTYHERNDCTYTFTKDRYPLAIIHEWSLTPIGTKRWDEREVQEKMSLFQDHAIKGIRHAERVRTGEPGEGMKLNGKAIIGIGIILIVIVAILMQSV